MTKKINEKLNELKSLLQEELADNVKSVQFTFKHDELDIKITQIPNDKRDELNLKGMKPACYPDSPYFQIENNEHQE